MTDDTLSACPACDSASITRVSTRGHGHKYSCNDCGHRFDDPETRPRQSHAVLRGDTGAAALDDMDADAIPDGGQVPDDPTDILDDADDKPFDPDETITKGEAEAMLKLHEDIHFTREIGSVVVGIGIGVAVTAHSIQAWDIAYRPLAVAAVAAAILGTLLAFFGPRAILSAVGGDGP